MALGLGRAHSYDRAGLPVLRMVRHGLSSAASRTRLSPDRSARRYPKAVPISTRKLRSRSRVHGAAQATVNAQRAGSRTTCPAEPVRRLGARDGGRCPRLHEVRAPARRFAARHPPHLLRAAPDNSHSPRENRLVASKQVERPPVQGDRLRAISEVGEPQEAGQALDDCVIATCHPRLQVFALGAFRLRQTSQPTPARIGLPAPPEPRTRQIDDPSHALGMCQRVEQRQIRPPRMTTDHQRSCPHDRAARQGPRRTHRRQTARRTVTDPSRAGQSDGPQKDRRPSPRQAPNCRRDRAPRDTRPTGSRRHSMRSTRPRPEHRRTR